MMGQCSKNAKSYWGGLHQMTNFEFKGTPGPWHMEDYDCEGGYDGLRGAITIANKITLDHGNYGQSWNEPEHFDEKQFNEMKADARLIAAAPEMFECLKLYIDLLEKMNYSGSFNKTVEDLLRRIVEEEHD